MNHTSHLVVQDQQHIQVLRAWMREKRTFKTAPTIVTNNTCDNRRAHSDLVAERIYLRPRLVGFPNGEASKPAKQACWPAFRKVRSG